MTNKLKILGLALLSSAFLHAQDAATQDQDLAAPEAALTFNQAPAESTALVRIPCTMPEIKIAKLPTFNLGAQEPSHGYSFPRLGDYAVRGAAALESTILGHTSRLNLATSLNTQSLSITPPLDLKFEPVKIDFPSILEGLNTGAFFTQTITYIDPSRERMLKAGALFTVLCLFLSRK